jgi:predicted SprT family Zn-dependent metalloprotease
MNVAAAHNLANDLMREHGVPREWLFCFDRSKVRFGKCDYRRKRISLSSHLVNMNDEQSVRDTILHEIAHALAPRGAGHGPTWRSIALAIGCSGSRCYGSEVQRPKPKYRGTCKSCGRVIHRHRRSLLACGHCTPVFDSRCIFVWTEDGSQRLRSLLKLAGVGPD